MKLICFSDWQRELSIHLLLRFLQSKKPDFLIFAGDGLLNLVDKSLIKENSNYVMRHSKELGTEKTLKLINIPKSAFLYVEGNDDPNVDIEYIGAINLSKRVFRCGKYNFLGISGSTDPIGGINRTDERRIEKILKKVESLRNIVIVSHVPPFGILDKTPRGMNVGSKTLREFLEANTEKITLIMCGHAHNMGGKWQVCGNTTIINCAMSIVEVELKEKMRIRVIF